MSQPNFFIIHEPGSNGFFRRANRDKKTDDKVKNYMKRILTIRDMSDETRPSWTWNAKTMCRELLNMDGVTAKEIAMVKTVMSQL